MLGDRTATHRELSVALGSLSDVELAGLVAGGSVAHVGVGGGSTIVDVGGVSVFVKRVPLTDVELARPGDTSNLFGVPSYCQYGVVSPGFNAWRELVANQLVTEHVLAGATAVFPLLHHWRVLPGRPPVADEHVDVDAVVARLGGHPAVRARLDALATASHSLVLCFEYLPHALPEWVDDDPVGKADALARQMFDAVEALARLRLLHMDAHFGNMRGDGERVCLTDFGLVTSTRFALSHEERRFVQRNATHDAGYAAMRLVNWLVTRVCGVTELVARNDFVVRCARGDVPADAPSNVATLLARHAPAAATMNAFYWRLFDGDIHADYPG